MSPRVSESHKAERRRQIMAAAEDAFRRKGFNATAMEDVISAVTISRGGVYKYFDNKTDLLLALLNARDAAIVEELARLRASHNTSWGALDEILATLEARLHDAADGMDAIFSEFFMTRWRDPEQRQFLQDRYARNLAPFIELLRDGVASGEFRPQVPVETVARFLASHWDGLLLGTLLVGGEELAVTEQIAQMRAYLRQALYGQSPEKETQHA